MCHTFKSAGGQTTEKRTESEQIRTPPPLPSCAESQLVLFKGQVVFSVCNLAARNEKIGQSEGSLCGHHTYLSRARPMHKAFAGSQGVGTKNRQHLFNPRTGAGD